MKVKMNFNQNKKQNLRRNNQIWMSRYLMKKVIK